MGRRFLQGPFFLLGLTREGGVALHASRQNQCWPVQQGHARYTSSSSSTENNEKEVQKPGNQKTLQRTLNISRVGHARSCDDERIKHQHHAFKCSNKDTDIEEKGNLEFVSKKSRETIS